jgi:hypothetical protein
MLKITKTVWYQESVRYSSLSGQKFNVNAIVSLTLLVALAVSACLAH